MKRLFVLLFLTFAVCSASARELIVLKSEFLQKDDSVLVFSPASTSGVVPTLFLLHGRSGSYASWSSHVDLQELADYTGWRIICPDGLKMSWYVNSDACRWRDFFWKELWQELTSRYAFEPSSTFIAGLSMGGGGAVNIFLDHPELFRGAGTMSGSLDYTYITTSARKDLPVMMNDTTAAMIKVNAESAVTRILAADVQALKDKIIVISCGTEDSLLPCSRLLEARCLEKGIPCIALYAPGVHKWPFWTWALEYYVGFFKEQLGTVREFNRMDCR